jgi:hypothetical protein
MGPEDAKIASSLAAAHPETASSLGRIRETGVKLTDEGNSFEGN